MSETLALLKSSDPHQLSSFGKRQLPSGWGAGHQLRVFPRLEPRAWFRTFDTACKFSRAWYLAAVLIFPRLVFGSGAHFPALIICRSRVFPHPARLSFFSFHCGGLDAVSTMYQGIISNTSISRRFSNTLQLRLSLTELFLSVCHIPLCIGLFTCRTLLLLTK